MTSKCFVLSATFVLITETRLLLPTFANAGAVLCSLQGTCGADDVRRENVVLLLNVHERNSTESLMTLGRASKHLDVN